MNGIVPRKSIVSKCTKEEFCNDARFIIRLYNVDVYTIYEKILQPLLEWFALLPGSSYKVALAVDMIRVYYEICYTACKALNRACSDTLVQSQARFLAFKVADEVEKELKTRQESLNEECKQWSKDFIANPDIASLREILCAIIVHFQSLLRLYSQISPTVEFKAKETKQLAVVRCLLPMMEREVLTMFDTLVATEHAFSVILPPITKEFTKTKRRWKHWSILKRHLHKL